MLNEPSLAILIDCWHSSTSSQLPNNILEFISRNNAIGTIVLASYNCNTEFIKANSIWYTNNHTVFFHASLRKIRELHHVHKFHLIKDKSLPEQSTHHIILNHIDTDKFQIAMHWPWQLEYYLTLHPEIKSIYVLGEAWDSCVEKRNLGYVALTEIHDINILTNVKCVKSLDGTHPNLDLDPNWAKVTDDIYQYILADTRTPSPTLSLNNES